MRSPALIFTLFIVTASFAGSSNVSGKLSQRVKADKPTVYLDYVCQDREKVYLRLYNNTVWHISVTTSETYYPSKTPIKLRNGVSTYAAPDDKNISLQYRVEKYALPWENVRVPKIKYADNGAISWVASEDSILFSVPVEYLRKDLQVFVTFNYEWEITEQGYSINDPEHRISYRGLDLSHTKPLACENVAAPEATALRPESSEGRRQ
jgi:hypothetical protein